MDRPAQGQDADDGCSEGVRRWVGIVVSDQPAPDSRHKENDKDKEGDAELTLHPLLLQGTTRMAWERLRFIRAIRRTRFLRIGSCAWQMLMAL